MRPVLKVEAEKCFLSRLYGYFVINKISEFAGIAQLVERNLAKVEVGSSSLLSRSKF